MNALKILLKHGGNLENKISGLFARYGRDYEKERLNKTPISFLRALIE